MNPVHATLVDPNRTLRPEFAPFLTLMGFLGALLGPKCEVVLHDTSDLSRSVVALTNGALSGRSVGAPATDLVLKVLRNHGHGEVDYLTNYLAESAAGGHFRSSTFFIRDGAGGVIGMLCINIDDTELLLARDALNAITATVGVTKDEVAGSAADTVPDRAQPVRTVAERLSITVDDLTLDSVARIVAAQPAPPARMTSDEKIGAVRDLDEAGVFLLKGSVARAAEVLQLSPPTVYRYLRTVRRSV